MIGSVGAGGVFLSGNRIDAIMAPPYMAIKEAGGIITDFSGRPWTTSSKNFIASGRKSHSMLMKEVINLS